MNVRLRLFEEATCIHIEKHPEKYTAEYVNLRE